MLTALIVLALFFVGVKYVIPFIRKRNAISGSTTIQGYGPQGGLPPKPPVEPPVADTPKPRPPKPPVEDGYVPNKPHRELP